MKTLSVVIPVYNERSTLRTVLARVLAVDLRRLGLRRQLVVVDDCSTDGTREIVQDLAADWRAALAPVFARHGTPPDLDQAEVVTLLHPKNQGKGAAVRTGLARASGDFVLIQDADLEYDPGDYPALLQPLLDDRADVVYGSRFLASERRVLLFWHSIGNQLLTLLGNAVTDLNLTDMETCYKVFRAEVLQGIHLERERFGFDPEITVKIARRRWRIYEVPIRYDGRGYELGKKIGWKDGLEVLWCLLYFTLKHDPVEGSATEDALQKLSGMATFNQQLFQAMRPWLGRRILQVGAGYGAVTDYLLRCGDVIAADSQPRALATLRSNYANHDTVTVLRWELGDALAALPEGVDTLVAINVLDRLPDEAGALRSAAAILAPTRGRLVLLVPAHPGLYAPLDRAMGRARRYSRAQIQDLLAAHGFEIEHSQWFNLLGLAGWAINGKVLGAEKAPPTQFGIYKRLSQVMLPVEAKLPLPTGLSLLVVARPSQPQR